MSCLMQKPENTAALADWIARLVNTQYEFNGMDAPIDLKAALFDAGCVDMYGFCDDGLVYNALRNLNGRAYAGRYKESLPDPISYTPNQIAKRTEWTSGERDKNGYYDGGHFIVAPWHYQLFKMLQFFNYQCLEDATYNSDLRKGLEKLEKALACFIVQNSETYQGFQWE